MVSERNRKLKNYIEKYGIFVNIGKNKARGNKGFFKYSGSSFRIDIANNLSDEGIFSVLVHEFAHFIHYRHDKALKKLDFIFDELTDEMKEELIKITIEEVPKEYASALFTKKDFLKNQIKALAKLIKTDYPDFRLSTTYKSLENSIKMPAKYLLKYDRIRFSGRLYTIDTAEADFDLSPAQSAYIALKSKQRAIARLNARISRLNRYYNSPTELFARLMALYVTDKNKLFKIAPEVGNKLNKAIATGKVPELAGLTNLFG